MTEVEHKTGYAKRAQAGLKGLAVKRAKALAKSSEKNVAILDHFLVISPKGEKRDMTSIEREYAVNIAHGEFLANDTLAMSSIVPMAFPGKGVVWPGGRAEPEPTDIKIDPADMAGVKPLEELPLANEAVVEGEDFTPKPEPVAEEFHENEPVPELQVEPAPKTFPAERPSGMVEGTDGLMGPDPRVTELILAGLSHEQALAKVSGHPIVTVARGAVPEDVPPTITENPDAEPTEHDAGRTAELVMVPILFKARHYVWLADTEKYYADPNLTFQRLIDKIVASAYARDTNRKSRGRHDAGGFSGSREKYKAWGGGAGV